MRHTFRRWHREASFLALIILIFLSILVVSPWARSPRTLEPVTRILHQSKDQTTALNLTVTITSTAITLLPDDAATPIANEISQLSDPLMLSLCALYLMEYTLPFLEQLAFTYLVPIGLGCLALSLYVRKNSLQRLGWKLILAAIICAGLVPLSAQLINSIYVVFDGSINATKAKIDDIHNAFSQMLGEGTNGDVLKLIENFAKGVGSLLDFLKSALGLLIDAVATLVITSCVIPLATTAVAIWGIKSIIAYPTHPTPILPPIHRNTDERHREDGHHDDSHRDGLGMIA